MPLIRCHGSLLGITTSLILILAGSSVIQAQKPPRGSGATSGGTASSETPSPPPPTSYIYTQVSVSTVNQSGQFVQTATCGAGDQLLGGGYLNPDNNHPFNPNVPWAFNISVKANYPSDKQSWTVVFDNHAQSTSDTQAPLHYGEIVQSYAYCFHVPNYSLDIIQQVADNAGQTSLNQTISVPCPAGSVLTGGGFAVDGATTELDAIYTTYNLIRSVPTIGADGIANGWEVGMSFLNANTIRPTRSYALCARRGLEALPVAVISLDHTKDIAAIGEYEDQVECPDNGLTTAGGTTYIGDPLIAHPILISRSVSDFRRWHSDYFGAWQTPNYTLRPCTAATDCFASVVSASCFKPPAIPFIHVVITSPASGAHFDWDKSTGAKSRTGPITFTAQVFDRNGALLPDAKVTWQHSSPLETTKMGSGSSVVARLPAGAAVTLLSVRATARSGKLMSADAIQISTGTVQ